MIKKTLGLALLVLLASMAGAGIYAGFFAPKQVVYIQQEAPFAPTLTKHTRDLAKNAGLPDFVHASNVARPAVVHIKSSYRANGARRDSDFFSNPFRDFFDEDKEMPPGMASGSGVIISEDGYIATNNHVIEDADEVEVTLFDNRTFRAKVIGKDVTTDLALLKITGESLPHLNFGSSDEINVGEWVLAVGNPMDLNSTVTAGIVSAKGRNINLLRADSEYAIESFIQTDAAVNKGNSGGALVNMNGELIGINTAIASRTGYYAGYSFAIPASIVRKVMEDLLTFGEVRRGILGVQIQSVNFDLAERNKLTVLKGAYVSEVNKSSGAEEAGIRRGDVIVSVNNIPVINSSELQEQVSRYRPGDNIQIQVIRGQDTRELTVALKPLGSSIKAAELRPSSFSYKGSSFRMVSSDEAKVLGVDHGVIVEEAGDKMARGGIQEGFVITEVDGKAIRSMEELESALVDSGDYVTIKGLYSKGMMATYSFSW